MAREWSWTRFTRDWFIRVRHRTALVRITYGNRARFYHALKKSMRLLCEQGPRGFARSLLAKVSAPELRLGENKRPPNAEEDRGGYNNWLLTSAGNKATVVRSNAVSALILEGDEPSEWICRSRSTLEAAGIAWAIAGSGAAERLESTLCRVVLRAGEVLHVAGLREVVGTLAQTDADMAFADHDYLDGCGHRIRPYFKGAPNVRLTTACPDWLGPCVLRSRACWWGGGAERLALLGVEMQLARPTRVIHVSAMMSSLSLSNRAMVRRNLASRLHKVFAKTRESALQVTGCLRGRGPLGTRALSVSAVVPFRKRPRLLMGCLEAVTAGGCPDVEMVLVNNGVPERRFEAIAARWQATLVSSPGEFNFSALCNAGAARSHGDLLLFLNNDVMLRDPGWLREMAEEFADPCVGVVGNLLLYPDDTVQHGGVALGFGVAAGHLYRYYQASDRGYHDTLQNARDCFAVTGACLMIRREVLAAIGGWDESLPVDFNDVLLCARVWEAGWRVVWTPHSRLVHLESQTRERRIRPQDLIRFQDLCSFRQDPFYSKHLRRCEPGFELALDVP